MYMHKLVLLLEYMNFTYEVIFAKYEALTDSNITYIAHTRTIHD